MAALLTLVTGYDYLRAGLPHIDPAATRRCDKPRQIRRPA